MALLRRSTAGAGGGHLPLALVVATFAGCVLVEMLGGGQPPLAFSHRLHVEDEGLDCSSCHATWEDSDEPGMPTLAVCMLCHADTDEEQPPERRVASLFEGETYRAARKSALSPEVIFSHRRHATDEDSCGLCHQGVAESERVDERAAVSMDECSACHVALGVANECSTCHSVLGEDVAPGNHDHHWDRVHGQVFRAGSDEVAARCSLCHTETSCTSCHRDQRPTSHTTYFDRRGHGPLARLDRQRCAACHESDSCDRCHREVAPTTHFGSWGGTKSQHCLGCHFGFSDQSCFTCHQGTPSHALAPPKPPDHTPGMNCLLCHGVTQPLPHVNKGDDCNLCHQ